jgi:hypothetical protein
VSPGSKKICLLLLVGDIAPGFLESLKHVVPLISQWVVHDVSGRSSLGPVLKELASVAGAYGERPWVGEAENRQELLNLLPPGELGLLIDSRTLIRPWDEPSEELPDADIYFAQIFQGATWVSRALLVQGGLGAVISSGDFTQVAIDESYSQARWNSARFERF